MKRFKLILSIMSAVTMLSTALPELIFAAGPTPAMKFSTTYQASIGTWKTISAEEANFEFLNLIPPSNAFAGSIVAGENCDILQFIEGSQTLSNDGNFIPLICKNDGGGGLVWTAASGGAFSSNAVSSSSPAGTYFDNYSNSMSTTLAPNNEWYKLGLGTKQPVGDIHVYTENPVGYASLRLEHTGSDNAIWELRSNQLVGLAPFGDNAFSLWGGREGGTLKEAFMVTSDHRVVIADEMQGGTIDGGTSFNGHFDRNSNSKLSIQKNHSVIDTNFIYSGRSALSLAINNGPANANLANGDGIGMRFSVNSLGWPTAAIVAQASDTTNGAGHLHFTTRKPTDPADNRFAVSDIDMTIRDTGLVSVANPAEDGTGFTADTKFIVNGDIGLNNELSGFNDRTIQGLKSFSTAAIRPGGSAPGDEAVSVGSLRNYFSNANIGSCFAIRKGASATPATADFVCRTPPQPPTVPGGLLIFPGSTNGYIDGTAYNPAGGSIPAGGGPIMCQYIWCNP